MQSIPLQRGMHAQDQSARGVRQGTGWLLSSTLLTLLLLAGLRSAKAHRDRINKTLYDNQLPLVDFRSPFVSASEPAESASAAPQGGYLSSRRRLAGRVLLNADSLLVRDGFAVKGSKSSAASAIGAENSFGASVACGPWSPGGGGSYMAMPAAAASFAESALYVFGAALSTKAVLTSRDAFDGSNGFIAFGGLDANARVYAGQDVNQDGIGDVLVSGSAQAAGAGEVRLLLLQSPQSQAQVDISVLFDGAFGLKITGSASSAGIGSASAMCPDVTGDGLPDAVFTSVALGGLWVLIGRSTPWPAGSFTAGAGGGSLVSGGHAALVSGDDGDAFGYAVACAGDVNGDGQGDIIVSAPLFDQPGFLFSTTDDVGRVRVLTGGPGRFSGTVSATSRTEQIIRGDDEDLQVGFAVAGVGDINSDGFDDVAVSSPFWSANRGAVAVVFGRSSPSSELEFGDFPSGRGVLFVGLVANFYLYTLGSSAGDVNGDGFSDFVMGAPLAGASSGHVFMIYGRGAGVAWPNTFPLASVGVDGTLGFAVTGPADSQLGSSLCVGGDMDGDSFGDIVLGAPRYNAQAAPSGGPWDGATYVIRGRTTGTPSPSSSATSTNTPSSTGTPSASSSGTPTTTPSSTGTGTPSVSPTGSGTPSSSATPSQSGSPSVSPSVTATATASPTSTFSVGASPSMTATGTRSPTGTASPTKTASGTASPTGTASPSSTGTPSVSSTGTVSSTPSVTASSTGSGTPSISSTGTVSPTPSGTMSPSPSETSTPSGSSTATPSVSHSSSSSGTPSGSASPSQSASASVTGSSSHSATPSSSPSTSSTASSTATGSASAASTSSSGLPPPSSSPSTAPLVPVTPSRTPSRSPSRSPTPRPSRSAGASAFPTPSPSSLPEPFLVAAPGSISLQVQWSATAPMRDSATVTVQTPVHVQWTLTIPASAPWLRVQMQAGAGGASLRLAVVADGSAPGTLRTSLTLQAVGSSPLDGRGLRLPAVSIPVVVLLAAPRAQLAPASLQLQLQLPLGSQASSRAVLSSTGSLALEWSAAVVDAANAPWLQLCASRPCVAQPAGSTPPGSIAELPLYLNASAVPGSGLYQAVLHITSNDAFGSSVLPLRVQMLVTALNILPSAPLLVTQGDVSSTTKMLLVNLLPQAVQVQVSAAPQSTRQSACSWLRLLHTQPAASSKALEGGLSLAMPPLGGIAHLHLVAQQQPPPCPSNDSVQLQLLVTSAGQQVDLRLVTVALQYKAGGADARASHMGATYNGQALLQSPSELLPALYTAASVVSAGGQVPRIAAVSRDALGSTPRAAREVAPEWLFQHPAASIRDTQPPIRLNAQALQSEGAVFSGTVQRTGGAILTIGMAGRLLGSGAPGAAPAMQVQVAEPVCGVGQRISLNGLACECAEGWQRSVQATGAPSALRCERCSAGSVRLGFEVDSPLCTVCPAGTYATGLGTRCAACPPRGVVCAGGQLQLLPQLWCDTCPAPDSFNSNSEALLLAFRSKQLPISGSDGSRALAVRSLSQVPRVAALDARVTAALLFADCQPPSACELGSVDNTTVVQCTEGNQGPLCGECAAGWAKPGADSVCVPCSEGGRDVAVSIVVIVLVVAVIIFLMLQRAGDENAVAVGPVWRIVSGWAQLAAMLQGLRLRADSPTDSLVDTVGGVSKGFTPTSTLAQCAFQLDFYQQLWATAALPFGVLLLFPALGWAALQLKRREQRIRRASAKCCAPVYACCSRMTDVVQDVCCGHACCARCGCRRSARVKRGSVVPMLDMAASSSLNLTSSVHSPPVSLGSTNSGPTTLPEAAVALPMPTAGGGAGRHQAHVRLPVAMVEPGLPSEFGTAKPSPAAPQRLAELSTQLFTSKGGTQADLEEGASLPEPRDHTRTLTGFEPLHVITSILPGGDDAPSARRLPPLPLRPVLGAAGDSSDAVQPMSVQQRIEQLAQTGSLTSATSSGHLGELSPGSLPLPYSLPLHDGSDTEGAAGGHSALESSHAIVISPGCPAHLGDSDSSSDSEYAGSGNESALLQAAEFKAMMGSGHGMSAHPVLTSGSAGGSEATFCISEEVMIRPGQHSTDDSMGIGGGGTGVSYIVASALGENSASALHQLRQVSTDTDGGASTAGGADDQVSALVSSVLGIRRLKSAQGSPARNMRGTNDFASSVSTELGMPAADSRVGRMLWAMTSSAGGTPTNKAMPKASAHPEPAHHHTLPPLAFTHSESLETPTPSPSRHGALQALTTGSSTVSGGTTGRSGSELMHLRVAPLPPLTSPAQPKATQLPTAVQSTATAERGIALRRGDAAQGGEPLSGRRRVHLPPVAGMSHPNAMSQPYQRLPLLPAGLPGAAGVNLSLRSTAAAAVLATRERTNDSGYISARSSTAGGGLSLLLSLRARLRRKKRKRRAAQSPITIKAYTLRAMLVALNMLHFGIVETCLRVLDVQPFPVLGFTLFRHDASHGSFDAQFLAARTVAVLLLLLVGLGLPIMGAVFLYRNRHKMERVRFKHAAGFLYEGYRRGASGGCCGGFWYWELLVVTLRKVLLLIVAVTVSQPFLQSAVIVLILVVSLILQVAAAPYMTHALNVLEAGGLLCLAAIALLGLSQGDEETNLAGLQPASASALTVLCSLVFLLAAATVVSSVLCQRVQSVVTAARKRFGLPPPKRRREGALSVCCCCSGSGSGWGSMTGEQRSVVLAAVAGFYAFASDDSDDDLSYVDGRSMSAREEEQSSLSSHAGLGDISFNEDSLRIKSHT